MSDGNSPITRYVVEKADARTHNFTTASHTDCNTLEFKVSQLNRGKHYLIRVFAENVIGQSEPICLQEPVRLPLEQVQYGNEDESRVLNDRWYWNFHVGPEGCFIRVRNVSLTIPKGALEKERTISIAFSYNTSDRPKLPYNQLLVGPVVHCLPHGMAFKHCVTLSFDYDPEAVQESSKMLVLCSETDVDEPMRWKEYKPPAECPKTCSIVTNHFTAYALVIQKPVTAIMPAAVAAIVSAMLAVAWSGGTTEIVAVSAAAVGFLVALIYSALWSGATTMTAPMNESLPGLPPADCEWTEESKRWCSKLTNLKESENKLVCENENFLIDTGSSGTRVYVGFYSRLGKTVEEAAVKVVPTDGNKAKALTERNNEAKILLTKRHINIVDYYIAESVMYKYELCDYTLDAWITEKKCETHWSSMACDLVYDLLTALDYLHQNEVLHCDLTPENILVHASGQLKLGDFGISRKIGHKPIVHAGTPRWKAKRSTSVRGTLRHCLRNICGWVGYLLYGVWRNASFSCC
ncbi:hypothetical protein LSAT2_023224 [Lamellibrachia satsuma]|nr:hypothetical protein LSAT2_023224 [Lamellibrachia satsuma]